MGRRAKAVAVAALLIGVGVGVGVAATHNSPRRGSASQRAKPVAPHPRVATTAPTGCRPAADLVQLVTRDTHTIDLPPRRCWTVTRPLVLQAHTDLTVDGNGDAITDPARGTGWSPILELFQDQNITLRDLRFYGPGTGGNEYTEGDFGIIMESDHDVRLVDVSIVGVAGDFLGLYPAGVQEHQRPGYPDGANVNVTVRDCDWTSSGYHGVTIEAVRGATFEGDTIARVHTDAIDMEYDGGIDAPDPLTGPGWPQSGVSFRDDTFYDDGGVTFNVANTGSTTVNDLVFEDNRLTGSTSAIFDVSGVSGGHPVTALTISGNTAEVATGGPNPNDTIHLVDVDGATIAHNRFPWYWYVEPAHTAHLYKTAVDASDSTGVTVEDNTFPGAQAPASGSIAVSCGNTFSVLAWQDLPSSQPPCGSSSSSGGLSPPG